MDCGGARRSAVQLGANQTCNEFIAAVCERELPDNHNVQVCVLSLGFDVEGVVAQLLHQHMQQQRSRRVYCVIVPDHVFPGSVSRLARAVEWQLNALATKSAAAPSAEKQADSHTATAAPSPPPPSASSSASASTPVVAIEEGTGTKERCALYQRGAIVLLTSRSLCADLLHRRLAVELIGMAVLLLPNSLLGGGRVQDALAPQTAFCTELLLRSGIRRTDASHSSGGHTSTDRHTPPPIVLLSDAPMLMQSLVQRHHMGAERFVQQLHVGDMQLFPRFRLDFVRHFEELSRGEEDDPHTRRAFEVDQVVAPVPASVLALDGLLAKIVLETLQELQRLEEQRLQQQRRQAGLSTSSDNGLDEHGMRRPSYNGSPAARRAAAAEEADEDVAARRFMPRARLTANTVNGHLDYSGYLRSGGSARGSSPSSSSASAATAAPPPSASYVRRGWRNNSVDDKGIWYGGISEAAVLAVDFYDLDSDLRAVVRRHESHWPFRLLTESLIDVRRLRRAARGTAFAFLLTMESVLERRLPRRSVYGTGTTPPAALWTLSSHFNDVVTVATHRIGTVVYAPVAGAVQQQQQPPSSASPADAVVVIDSSEEDEGEEDGESGVRAVESTKAAASASPPTHMPGQAASVSAAAAPRAVPQLIPNTEEQETDVEVVVRLVTSWCRTILRRKRSRAAAAAAAAAEPSASETHAAPTLLLLTFGQGTVVRYTERLTHEREVYQQLQLRRFMELYQAKYGVQLTEYTKAPEDALAGAVEEQLKTALFEAESVDADASSDDGGEGEADEALTDAGGPAGSSRRVTQGPGGRAAASSQFDRASSSLYGESGGTGADVMDSGVSAFHQALLTQPVLPRPTTSHSISQTDRTAATVAVTVGVDDTSAAAALAAGPASATATSTATTAAVKVSLTVERVRAGAVTLCAVDDTAAAAAASTRGGMTDPFLSDGVSFTESFSDLPRVLVMDGGHLSATELTMLLDGSHEALQFSAPALTSTTATVTAEEAEHPSGAAAAGTLSVDRVILSRQQLSLLRQLEMVQDRLPGTRLRSLKVQLITTSLAGVDFKKAVQAEQVAFESLAHTKATLTGTLLVDQSSLRQTEEALESGLQVARRRGTNRKGNHVALLAGQFVYDRLAPTTQPPCIIFDEREFRSTLPYDLFRRGMELVPLTLTTADYVLSPEYAVERKSLSDYYQSVASGRIQHQLAALSRKYEHPMCLIEFHRSIPFRILQTRMYARTARLMAGYPRVSFLWARSPAHAAGMLVLLKKSVATANVDPSDPSLTGSSMDPGSAADAAGVAATAAEKEAAHYAARVLSKFPGITHQNAPRVMQLCGSLIGLATISQASLAAVMGEEDAARLYAFLHTPFHEQVE